MDNFHYLLLFNKSSCVEDSYLPMYQAQLYFFFFLQFLTHLILALTLGVGYSCYSHSPFEKTKFWIFKSLVQGLTLK